MGERKEIVRTHVSFGLQVDKALEILSIPKSTYYNKRTYNPKGRQATQVTQYQGELVSDEIVMKEMKSILSAEFIDYGYRKITYLLKERGYQIGKKKVYRLMKENKLLNPKKVNSNPLDKNIIKKKPKPTRPLEIIEIDIKYIYINGQRKNAYLITIYDTFHREAYEWVLSWSMKVGVIKTLILKFIDNVMISKNRTKSRIKITFRTDNGCQFTSKMYMQIMKVFEIETCYIPPATPQLNGHIESFHSTVERLVCERYEFQNLEDAIQVFTRFYNTYNNERILECLLNKSPKAFLDEWEKGIIEQKEKKNRLIFFFKEEGKEKKNASCVNSINHFDTTSQSMSSPFEVNLHNRIFDSARQN